MALFNRVGEIIIGQSGGTGVSIKDLRFSFEIEKNGNPTPNASKLKIYNLNATTRALIETPNNAVIVKAGYEQEIGAVTIFVGVVTRATTVRSGPDWITELELMDGVIAYRDSKISISFPAGTKATTVIAGVAARFGLPVKSLPYDASTKTYPQGFSFVGRIREAMDKACRFAGMEWSIQNQEIQVINKGGLATKTAIVLTPDTGMIGSPEPEAKTMSEKAAGEAGIKTNTAGVVKKQVKDEKGEVKTRLEIRGYKVKSLLQPSIYPGGYVKINSANIKNQFFRVEDVKHVGDTGGGDWQTEITVRFI